MMLQSLLRHRVWQKKWTRMMKSAEVQEKMSREQKELKAKVEAEMNERPAIMAYFPLQAADYITLKDRVARRAEGQGDAAGVATIDTAVSTLELAEHLQPQSLPVKH